MLKKFIFNEKRWTYCRTRPVEGIVRHTVCLFYRRYPFNLQICRPLNSLFCWWKVLTCVDCRVTRSRRNSKKNYALFLNQYNTNIKYTRTYIIFKPKKANKTRNKCTWSKTTKKKKNTTNRPRLNFRRAISCNKIGGYIYMYVCVGAHFSLNS